MLDDGQPEAALMLRIAERHGGAHGPAQGLRCNLEVSGGTAGMTADLRLTVAGGG
jgi:hypothetical protein